MADWPRTTVGELCRIKHGFAFKGEHFVEDGDLMVLSPGNFLPRGGLQLRDGKETFYDGEFPPEFLLDEGDLLVAMTDLKQDAPILGSTIRVPESGRYLHNQRLGLVTDIAEHVDSGFLYYMLNSDVVRSWLRATATGSTVRHTAPERIYAANIRLPSIEEQAKIAASLEALDHLIENNRRRIDILEEMARLIYREWFVHFRFPGHKNVELVDSDLGPIPEGWAVTAFTELAHFVNGFAFKPNDHWMDDGLPIIKIKELKSGVTRDTPRYHGEDIPKKYFIDNGDLLFSWSADLDAYVWPGGPALLNQHLFVVRPRDVSSIFLFQSLRGRMDEFRSRSQGTTMKHIKRSALSEVLTVVPDRVTREAFEESVGPMLELQLNLIRQNGVLREARDLLLPRLISGELDVSDLDLDLEPVA